MVVEKVPPDGGYGWIIVLANALSNLIIVPMMQSFGLIFKDTFLTMGLSATEGGLIINLNAAFGMIMGLVNGVLLKVLGYRKCAMIASCFICIGIVLVSFSTTFSHFIITYGIITSLGFGLNMSSYSFALNCFFRKKKSTAVAYAMTITGLGPILMPQVINLLMQNYTVQGVTLILGGIATHSFVAAMLLQPIKWHMKNPEVEETPLEEEKETEEENQVKFSRSISLVSQRDRKQSSLVSYHSVEELETAPVYGMDSAFTGSIISIPAVRRMSSVSQNYKTESLANIPEDKVYNPDLSIPVRKKTIWQRLGNRAFNFFDLDLLKDPIYINLLVGVSVAVFAELNFSLLTPFILAEFGLKTEQIATFLSVLGIADIIFRFLAPYIGKFINAPPKRIYMVTLCLLMITRFSLLISNNFYVLLGVALGLGIAKGMRTVYMSLVIPTYVPIEKLASASGLQMMINGLCILIGGPAIGLIRDITGSYTMCIVVLNMITFTTIFIWTIEAIVIAVHTKKNKQGPAIPLVDRR